MPSLLSAVVATLVEGTTLSRARLSAVFFDPLEGSGGFFFGGEIDLGCFL